MSQEAIVTYEASDGQTVKLSPSIVARYIVTGGAPVSDRDLYAFMMKCKSRGLNPLAGDAYLVSYNSKYGSSPSVIVSKDYFLRTANQQPTYRGLRAGVVVMRDSGLEYREGTLCGKTQEKLVGGWAEVLDSRFDVPIKATVSLDEYNTGKSLWASKPATMIRKVALVQALREAYPQSYGGIYDSAEMPEQYQTQPQATEVEFEASEPMPQPAAPAQSAQPAPQQQPAPEAVQVAPEAAYQDAGAYEPVYEAEDIDF